MVMFIKGCMLGRRHFQPIASDMRKLIPLLLLVTACTFSAASQSGRRVATPRSAPAAPVQPDLTPEPEPPPRASFSELLFLPEVVLDSEIKGFDNSTFRLADFHGKTLVINIWASWCGPCRREVPEYERVRKAYVDRDVVFIALTTENPRTAAEKVDKFVQEVNFGFKLGWASPQVASLLMNGKSAIPQTIVIDPTGRVLKHWTGYAPRQSGTRLKDLIDQALSTAPQK
jgi:thiol-disulfide isomerase/thioredoxin